MQHRAPRNVRGRHRRTAALHSHRAPREPIAEKGRYAVAAALVAGVGVAGVATAGDTSTPAGAAAKNAARTSANALATASAAPTVTAPTPAAALGSSAPGVAGPTADPSANAATATASPPYEEPTSAPGSADLSFIPQLRKLKPLPQWVNPMPEGAVTSCFGPRWGRLHAGVDLATASGTPIRAVGAGVVVTAGAAQGYGNAVLIDHGNGYLTHYGHMSEITVDPGQRVQPGDQIGTEGSTGHSTGPHLHFEVHQGTYQNPIEPTRWLHEHGVDIPGCTAL